MKTRITQDFLGGKSTPNRQKMDPECTICIHFPKKFPGGRPPDPTCRRVISTPASIQLRVKILPHHVYRSGALKTKITPKKWWKKIKTQSAKKWTQNEPFASIFLKSFPGTHMQEGDIHSRINTAKGINSPASRFFGAEL